MASESPRHVAVAGEGADVVLAAGPAQPPVDDAADGLLRHQRGQRARRRPSRAVTPVRLAPSVERSRPNSCCTATTPYAAGGATSARPKASVAVSKVAACSRAVTAASAPRERPRAGAAGDLGGAQDRRVVDALEVVRVRHPRRRRADAARVEQAAAPQQRRALHEEGAALGEEGLELRQVHLRRVRLHLAEVGVDGGLQREDWAPAPSSGRRPRASPSRARPRTGRAGPPAARSCPSAATYGSSSMPPRRPQRAQPHQLAHPRRPARRRCAAPAPVRHLVPRGDACGPRSRPTPAPARR